MDTYAAILPAIPHFTADRRFADPTPTINISVDNNSLWIYANNVYIGQYVTDQDFVILQQLDFGAHTIKVEIDPLHTVASEGRFVSYRVAFAPLLSENTEMKTI